MPPPRPSRFRTRLTAAVVTFVVLIAIAASLALRGLTDFDLSGRYIENLTFDSAGKSLSGTLVLPDENHDGPIAIMVHGDGPQDRFSSDAYLPLINALLDHGIGIYSWDKAGIGHSTGNWLDQSMTDRAVETKAAFDMVSAKRPTQQGKIGLLGFSQAGWVIPKASPLIANNAFNVIIGGAVNWQDQGAFYTRQRLLTEGLSDTEISERIAESLKRDEVTFALDADYQSYIAATNDPHPISEDRFGFVKRNINSDATADLKRLRAPTLAIFGADDLNVDARNDAAIYRDLLEGRHPQNEVTLIADATHGLLRAGMFNYQLAHQMPLDRQILFLVMGQYAFASEAIDHITKWINSAHRAN